MNTPQQSHKPPFGLYLATSIVVFFLTLSAADSVGFVPCQMDGTCAERSQEAPVTLADLPELGQEAAAPVAKQTPEPAGVLPARIKIATIGLDLPVQNPSTTNLVALDELLQQGPARHVASGKLGQQRSMVIFGHSSHLPIVHNKMFQAFNDVPTLKPGDSVEVDGKDGKAYLYSVDSVVKADTQTDTQNLIGDDGKLIVVTCDTLTGKSSRFILTASFIGVVTQ